MKWREDHTRQFLFMTQRRIYQDECPYFVTFRTIAHIPFFEKTEYAKLFSDIIFNAGWLKKYRIISYQIMPDHVHLLVYKNTPARTLESVRSVCLINNERALSRVRDDSKKEYTISDLIQSIKGNFSRSLPRGNIWQKRFYHRIVNTDEYFYTVISYIKRNPVKAGLSDKYQKMPYWYLDEVCSGFIREQ